MGFSTGIAGYDSSNTTTVVATGSMAVDVGDVLVGNLLSMESFSGQQPTTLTDNLGNTYAGRTVRDPGIGAIGRQFVCVVGSAGTITSATGSFSAALRYKTLGIVKLTGMDSVGPVADEDFADSSGGATATTPALASGGPCTVVACAVSTNDRSFTPNASPAFTEILDINVAQGGSGAGHIQYYDSVGAFNSAVSATASSASNVLIIAIAIKAAAAGLVAAAGALGATTGALTTEILPAGDAVGSAEARAFFEWSTRGRSAAPNAAMPIAAAHFLRPAASGATVALAVDAIATGAATGALTVSIQVLAASIGAGSAAGTLSTSIRTAGAAASLSAATGTLSVQIILNVAALAQGMAAAGLMSAILAAAAATGSGAASGTLSGLAASLQGAAGGSGAAVGQLDTGNAALAGIAVGLGTASGVLTTVTQLQGASIASALVQAAATTGIVAQGASIGRALATGDIATAVQLAVAAQAQAAATGGLSGQIQLNAAAAVIAAAAGDVSTAIRFAAAALAGGAASGDLATLPSGLSTSAGGRGQASGALLTGIPILGAPTAFATTTGELATGVRPAGMAQGRGLAEGGLLTGIALNGASVSLAQASGVLQVMTQFSTQAMARALAMGSLSTQVRLDVAVLSRALAMATLDGGLSQAPAKRTLKLSGLPDDRTLRAPVPDRRLIAAVPRRVLH